MVGIFSSLLILLKCCHCRGFYPEMSRGDVEEAAEGEAEVEVVGDVGVSLNI